MNTRNSFPLGYLHSDHLFSYLPTYCKTNFLRTDGLPTDGVLVALGLYVPHPPVHHPLKTRYVSCASHGMARWWLLDYMTQHPPVHHPLETQYDSVMDESQQLSSTWVTYSVNHIPSPTHYRGNLPMQ